MSAPDARAAYVPTVTREEAIRNAGRVLAAARRRRDSMTVEDAALAAYRPDLGGPSLPELEDKIRRMRAQAPASVHERRSA